MCTNVHAQSVLYYFGCCSLDDVLVGAPLYFKGSSLPEVGAVFIYENIVSVSCLYSYSTYCMQVVWYCGLIALLRCITQNGIGSLDNNQVIILTAPGGGVAYSRFGHAIAPLGDLDDDGFDGKHCTCTLAHTWEELLLCML